MASTSGNNSLPERLIEDDSEGEELFLECSVVVDASRSVSSSSDALLQGGQSPLQDDGDLNDLFSRVIDAESRRPSELDSSSPSGELSATGTSGNSEDLETFHELLESKIKELESARHSLHETRPSFDEESKALARARKKQTKEVRDLFHDKSMSVDEKLDLLYQKYVQQISDSRNLEKDLAIVQRKYNQAIREKESIFSEHKKGVALRQKLESLCRELQRQNKFIVEDSKRLAAEENKKRKELSEKFHSTIQEVSEKLEQQGNERLKHMKENEALQERMSEFISKFEVREKHFAQQIRTKDLEVQLTEAKFKKQVNQTMREEAKNRLLAEQISESKKSESELKLQIASYAEKFEQFQETLTKSNELFDSFKKEMEKMTRALKSLEKENLNLKKKCEKSDVSLIEILEEKNKYKQEADTLKTQKGRLESLCRSLQAERKMKQQQEEKEKDMGKETEMKKEKEKGTSPSPASPHSPTSIPSIPNLSSTSLLISSSPSSTSSSTPTSYANES